MPVAATGRDTMQPEARLITIADISTRTGWPQRRVGSGHDGAGTIAHLLRQWTRQSMAVTHLLAILCAGCQQHWPEPGQGGMVESRWPDAVAATPAPAALARRLNCTLGRLDALRQAATRAGQYTGEIALLDITATRAKREYAGKLFDDSRITTTELDAGIDRMAHEMVPPPAPLPMCT